MRLTQKCTSNSTLLCCGTLQNTNQVLQCNEHTLLSPYLFAAQGYKIYKAQLSRKTQRHPDPFLTDAHRSDSDKHTDLEL